MTAGVLAKMVKTEWRFTLSPNMYTICAMPYCPVATKGNYCTRHGGMTPAEEASENGEMRRRSELFRELHSHAQTLRGLDEDHPELADTLAAAEEARLHLAELFGEPIEDESP
jgi:hypothetical protein